MMIAPTFQMDLQIVIRVILACLLGCLIGWERERHRHIVSAGIRTYGAIALGSCAFGILSYYITDSDPSRIAAQVVTCIGFLGGGINFRQGDYVTGLTTAATLWATADVAATVWTNHATATVWTSHAAPTVWTSHAAPTVSAAI